MDDSEPAETTNGNHSHSHSDHRMLSHRTGSHKPALRQCLSSGTDSAIVIHDDPNHSDNLSNNSRSASRMAVDPAEHDRNITDNLAIKSNIRPALYPKDHSHHQTKLPVEQRFDEAAMQSQHRLHSDHGHLAHVDDRSEPGFQRRIVETINPCLSRPPSAYLVGRPHLPSSHTFPVLTQPHSAPIHGRCSSLHGPHELHGPEPFHLPIVSRNVSCADQRSVQYGDPYSPYYMVHSGSDNLSCASSQYCFSPNYPILRRTSDSEQHLPPERVRVFHTDSLSTNTPSLNYGQSEHNLLRKTYSLESKAETGNEARIDDESGRTFRRLITKTLSSVYAIFVIVLGAILYVNDVLGTVGHSYVEVFQVYLFMIAITFYMFIHIDIRRYLKHERAEEAISASNTSGLHGAVVNRFPLLPSRHIGGDAQNPKRSKVEKTVHRKKIEPYEFKTGRHAGSLYLKLGAVAFCFGSMIHDGLVFSKRLDLVVTQLYSSCMNIIDLFTPALNLVFSFYQLYFIFKHSNIVINRYQEVARLGVMHSIAVNLCVWFRTLVDETIDEFSRKWSGEGFENKDAASRMPDALKLMAEDSAWHPPVPIPGSAGSSLRSASMTDTNHSSAALAACMPETVLANIAQEAAPYLYPFTIEYTLIAAAVWYMIWSNIGNSSHVETAPKPDVKPGLCSELAPHVSNHPDGQRIVIDDHSEHSIRSSLYMIHVDCRSTNRGLFPGILVLVGTVISIIIFFVTISAEEYAATALIINNVSELTLFGITSFVTILAFRQTSRLDLNHSAMKHTLDDFLLFVALPCFFIFSFFSIIAGIAAYNYLSIVVNTSSMLQVILQTTFIFDGLRRCSNNLELQRKKPGREMITFLIVCNVAMWTFSTFEIKRSETNPSQMLFYGEFEWSIISHLSVPLTIFYRFHSSVCLVDIWRSAYQPAESH